MRDIQREKERRVREKKKREREISGKRKIRKQLITWQRERYVEREINGRKEKEKN